MENPLSQQDRQDKIKTLRDLQSGKLTLDDLKPKELTIKVGLDNTGQGSFFINGRSVTKEDYIAAKNQQPQRERDIEEVYED